VLYAYKKYRQFNNDEYLRQLDAAHQRYLHDYVTDTEAAHKKGFEEGMEEGMEKGIDEATTQIARNMKSLGISLSDIARATNLAVSIIEEL
jgi:predicted transposase/invertase (TIGR01784 family)